MHTLNSLKWFSYCIVTIFRCNLGESYTSIVLNDRLFDLDNKQLSSVLKLYNSLMNILHLHGHHYVYSSHLWREYSALYRSPQN